jgi:hypothetical protein
VYIPSGYEAGQTRARIVDADRATCVEQIMLKDSIIVSPLYYCLTTAAII